MSYTPKRFKHRITVGENGEFDSIESAIDWLENGNMSAPTELLLDSGSWDVENTIAIDLPYHLNIRGFDSNSVVIQPTTGMIQKPVFDLVSSVWIERLTIDGSNLEGFGETLLEDAIIITGSEYHEITGVVIANAYNGISLQGDGSSLWVFNSIIEDITNAGIEVSCDGVTVIDVSTNTFENCGIAIDLLESTDGVFTITNNIITCSAGQVGINYTPATYVYSDTPSIFSNHWNNVGTFRGGFDFSRADGRDANIHLISNVGDENKDPHFKVNVADNTSVTTVTTAGTCYKAVFTDGDTYSCKWKLEDNKYTYLQRAPTDIRVWVSGNIKVNGVNRNVCVSLRKDGIETAISPLMVRTSAANQPQPFSIIAYLDNFNEDSYFEIFLTSSTDGDEVIVQDLMIYAEGR
jgi:hypothetical protein